MERSTGLKPPNYTRVAVVQIDVHPAATADLRSPLEDPVFAPGRPDSLRPASGAVPERFRERFEALRARIRDVYCDELRKRLDAVVATCRSWGVRVLVFPEYSVPWQLLPLLARAAPDVTIVAGTHGVSLDALDLYRELGWPEEREPQPGQAVCPVLRGGGLVALQPKLHASKLETGLVAGDVWEPVGMEAPIPGPMGILVCLDFLYRESPRYSELVRDRLDACRFLAVPSLTPHYTLPEFAAKAWEEARRYQRPVLYADTAAGGGTSIFVDEKGTVELRDFPTRAGWLEKGDEGVIVADVDLGYHRAGPSTPYEFHPPLKPVAAASFVYTTHPEARDYGEWLDGLELTDEATSAKRIRALAAAVRERRGPLLEVAVLGGNQSRERRLRRLIEALPHLTRADQFRTFLREVVMPPDVLAFPMLRAALAEGAADEVFAWLREKRGAGFEDVEARLRDAGRPAREPTEGEWTEEGRAALARVIATVRGERTRRDREPEPRVVMPAAVDPAVLGRRVARGLAFEFRRTFRDFRHSPRLPGHLGRDLETTEMSMLFPPVYEQLRRLAVAGGASGEETRRASALVVHEDVDSPRGAATLVLFHDGSWKLLALDSEPGELPGWPAVRDGLADLGFPDVTVEVLSDDELTERLTRLLPLFDASREVIRQALGRRLEEVSNEFEEPFVTRLRSGERLHALTALGEWLGSERRTALLVGEFGSGKSTVLARWADSLWERGGPPRPILVDLATAGPSADAGALLLAAARLDDTPAHRAALEALTEAGLLLPVFDGFDEMATRLTAGELAGRLTELLRAAQDEGRVLVSSRDHYFPNVEQLDDAVQRALSEALGPRSQVERLHLELFTTEQMEELVRKILKEEADPALERIAGTYDLLDLVLRPLLLGMVLRNLDRLSPESRIGTADVYEAFLGRWLEQTRSGDPETLTDAQKEAFAEALAEQLWRGEQTSCSYAELRTSVRDVLTRELPAELVGPVELEIQGGAFFVWEGEERYRFAHKSFLEFFLARGLVRVLEHEPQKALDTRPFSREVAFFVGEILRRDGRMEAHPSVEAVRRWLRTGRQERSLEESAGAAANALRLLLRLERWSGREGWLAESADLRLVHMPREDLVGARLVGARFDGAVLSGSDLAQADLRGARFDNARLSGCRLDGADLDTARLRNVNLTQAGGCDVSFAAADLGGACLRQSAWARGEWRGTRLVGARLEAWASDEKHTPASWPRLGLSAVGTSAEYEGHFSSVFSMAWNSAGNRLASAGVDGAVRLWDPESGDAVAIFEGHRGYVFSVAWNSAGNRLASAGSDGAVCLWDPDSGDAVTLEGHRGGVGSVAWNENGHCLASAGANGTVFLWDPDSGDVVATFEGHRGFVRSVAWNSAGNRLASAGSDGTVRLWDVDSGDAIAILEGHSDAVWSVAWNADGNRLASAGDDGTVRLWDPKSGDAVATLKGHRSTVWSVAWDGAGNRLASAGLDDTVRLWDPDSGDLVAVGEGHHGTAFSVAWNKAGNRLASGGSDGTIHLWDPESGDVVATLEGHRAIVTSVAWDGAGNRLASAGSGGAVHIWDPESGDAVATLEGHGGFVMSVAWDGASNRLASAGDDGRVRLWDPEFSDAVATLEGHRGDVMSVAWDGAGNRLASAGADGTVRLWDPESSDAVTTFRGHRGAVHSVAWNSAGNRLASAGNDGTVRLWDPDSGHAVATLEGHHGKVTSVAWNSAGNRLASGGSNGTVCLWDPDSGAVATPFKGHRGEVVAVAWNDAGNCLASAGWSGTVRLWDPDSGAAIDTFEGHLSRVRSLAWAPGSQILASGSEDGSLRVWQIDGSSWRFAVHPHDEGSMVRSPSGFVRFQGREPSGLVLAVTVTDSFRVFLPWLDDFEAIFHQPDKVAADLAGQLPPGALAAEIEAHGWGGGQVWRGEPWIVEEPAAPAAAPAKPTPADTAPNPFRPGPSLLDVPALPGRREKLDELRALVDGCSPAALLGPRRSGKTSLLHHLARELGGAPRVRHRTLEGSRIRTADDLARVLEPGLGDDPAADLRDRLRGEDRPVLLLDEMAYLHEAEDGVFAWLRAVGQEGVGLVMAGTSWDWKRVVDQALTLPGSSFGNDVTPVPLGPLAEDDAVAFLADTAPGDVPLEAGRTARWIVDRCGAWPFYLQVMGHAVVQEARAGRRGALVEKIHLSGLYEEKLLVGRGHVFQGRYDELPVELRRVLLRIESNRPPPYRELSRTERRLAVDAGLCNSAGVWLADRPFFEWVQRNLEQLREKD